MKAITKKITLGFTVLFFALMLFLTFFAESIHMASLPRVTVSRVESKLFPVERVLDDGTVMSFSQERSAVSEELLNMGIYTVYSFEKNGTKRNYVREVYIETGEKTEDGYYEVVSGLSFIDRIVVESTGELYDGCEVEVE